jgi:hypothetical protein
LGRDPVGARKRTALTKIDSYKLKKAEWKTLAVSPSKNLLSTYLPPMNIQCKENLENLGKAVTRPYEQVEDVI